MGKKVNNKQHLQKKKGIHKVRKQRKGRQTDNINAATDDCGCCRCPYRELPKSCGFKAFLAAFRKKNCQMSVCEAKVQAMNMYWELPETEKEQWRKKRNCRPKCKVCCFPPPRCIPPPCKSDANANCCKPKFTCCPPPKCPPCPPPPCPPPPPCCDRDDRDIYRNGPHHYLRMPVDGACCNNDEKGKCEPDPNGSLGFRNYFKLFRCRYPYYSKCAALAKAKCKYCQLGEKGKAKYRIMGCNPKICCKPRQPCAA